MKANDLTLQAMAERTGLAVATIAALRGGTRGKRPHPDTVAKLAAAMDVNEAELDIAVAAGVGSARSREIELLSRFRQLDDDAKVAVETLLTKLVSTRRAP
ncbi:MAG TPA: helix-turn-helix transcriptional regulator [Mycobacteriales bacterium]|jgi:transcriptional regulator with XRE-family HTH domain|nr:helix-turn-helix transcriptional regulator [Mycobacteriales bacterium]